MVLASSAAAAAPAYELPRPLALCSIRANAEACACETPPAKTPATASERAVFLIPIRAMRISSLSVVGSRTSSCPLAADTITQRRCLANGRPRRQAGLAGATGLLGEGHPRELALADLEHDRVATLYGEILVGNFLSVHAHAALLDHAQGLRGAGDELRFLEHFHDRHLGGRARGRLSTVARYLDRNLRDVLWRYAVLETRLEIGLCALGHLRV